MKLMKTTTQSIDIFGDSFSCSCCKFNNDDTWLDILEKKYKFNLNNTSLHGTGAQWCIEKFMGLTEYSDYLLFCLPDMNRLSLDYIKSHQTSEASLIYSIMEDLKSFDFPDTISSDVKNVSDRVYRDYNSFYTTGLSKILEILFVSFIFTKHVKYKKILIWPSSGSGYPFRNYNFTLEIPENVHIVSRCINFISYFETKNTDVNKIFDENEKNDGGKVFFGKDRRNNHLSYENHKIMSKQIYNYFTKNKNPEISEFKREIYEMQ